MARKRRRGGSRNRNNRGRNARRGRDKGLAFWGDPDRLPEPITDLKLADEPAAVVHSLGPPPLHGRDAIAEHYFTLVYDRITMMSGAVASAAGMIEVDDLIEQTDDEDWDDADDTDEDDDETW